MDIARLGTLIIVLTLLGACGGGGDADEPDTVQPPAPPTPPTNDPLDDELRTLIVANGLTGDPSTGRDLPSINDPLAQLGKQLFFTKALGGEFDSACVSCHHPVMGGGDNLSLSFGVGAIDPDLLGLGRGDASGVPNVPRNAPTTFNIALWDNGLFWDSRVASLGGEALQNGAASGISTPDSGLNVIDGDAGDNLPVAQARFPVTSTEEMRGNLESGNDNAALRAHLAARIGGYGIGQGELTTNEWLTAFQSAFASGEPAQDLITFDNIVAALGAYERSQVFVNNPWRDYVRGDNTAISDAAKEGAILFFTDAADGGGGCVQCHSGDLFSNEEHHAIGSPQFGPGKGNPNDHDFGRENISGNAVDRFRFRTPSLLNIAVTGPYMHTGAYTTLDEVLDHYNNPNGTVDDFFDDGAWCQLPQFDDVANCAALYPGAEQNSNQALNKINQERAQNDPAALPNINLNNGERNDIEAFLQTLTDPCVENRDCLAPWIATAEDAMDDHLLIAIDVNGNPL
ncbi:MAG: cytochrome c peroxidase [Pseudomonadota bacterium]